MKNYWILKVFDFKREPVCAWLGTVLVCQVLWWAVMDLFGRCPGTVSATLDLSGSCLGCESSTGDQPGVQLFAATMQDQDLENIQLFCPYWRPAWDAMESESVG